MTGESCLRFRSGLPLKPYDRNLYTRRSSNAFCVAEEFCDVSSDFRFDDFGPTLETNACRHIVDNDQLPTDPKVLFDCLFVHGGSTYVTDAIVIGLRWHRQSLIPGHML
jgi:hypothetical protein